MKTLMITNRPMSNRKIFLLISFFFLILTSFRIGWVNYYQAPDQPWVEDGVIDLTDWKFTDDQVILLDGDWLFHPNQFIQPDTAQTILGAEPITVPGLWDTTSSDGDLENFNGYGTYRLKIILPDNEQSQPLYGIRMKEVMTAADLYMNGQLIAEVGQPATSLADSKDYYAPFTTFFHPEDNVT